MLGENNELRNRYMLINPPEEWLSQLKQIRTNSVQAPNKFRTSSREIEKLIPAVGKDELSVKQMLERTLLKHRPNFINNYLNPAIKEDHVAMRYPNNPHHPRQRYLLTVKGLAAYNAETT